MQRLHGPPRPVRWQVHRRLHQGREVLEDGRLVGCIPLPSSIPQVLVDELLAESNDIESRAVAEAERASLIDARDAAQLRRKRAIDLYTRAKLSDDEFDAIAADVEREIRVLDERLAGSRTC